MIPEIPFNLEFYDTSIYIPLENSLSPDLMKPNYYACWGLSPNNSRLPAWYSGEIHRNQIFVHVSHKIVALQPGQQASH